MSSSLAVGDRVLVYGGYDSYPDWLVASPAGYEGRVVAFIPGTNPAFIPGTNPVENAVVELDEPLVLPSGAGAVRGVEVKGSHLVLHIAWTGCDWSTGPTRLHVELCDFVPEPKPWPERRQGAWVESHAFYRRLEDM